MEGELGSLSIENSEEKTEEGLTDLGAKSPVYEVGKDNSGMLNSTKVSVERSEKDDVISETNARTSEESEKVVAITMSNQKSHLKGPKMKPGVILLGRGNSFSLGRSEVILLHNRPIRRSQGDAKRGSAETNLDSIQEQSNTPPSPPPISEKDVSSKMNAHTNGWNRSERDVLQEEVETVGDTDAFAKCLHQLWCKAEEVMTANEGRVLKVLEEFGIGELGGGGGDDGGEGLQEEEQVWQIVQENYRSQR